REWRGSVAIPAFDAVFAIFEHQLGSRRQFPYSLIHGVGRRREAIAEKQIESAGIHLRCLTRSRKHWPNLRPKVHRTFGNLVINELDAEWIAGDDQALLPGVPDRQSKHSIQMIQNIVTPLLISVNNDFCVARRPEDMPKSLQFAF